MRERTRDKDIRKHYAQLVNEFNSTKRVCMRERKRERGDRELNMRIGTGGTWQRGTRGAGVKSPCKQPCIVLGTGLGLLQECIMFSCRAT